MALVLKRMYNEYTIFAENRDTRFNDMPLTSPASTITLIAAYLYFVLSFGPKFMKNRPAYKIDKLLMIYNGIQVTLNFALSVHSILSLYFYMPDYNILCQPPDLSDTLNGRREAIGTYFYYLLKITDLTDTVFFVLRKKHQQISFLHVYHHVIVLLVSYAVFSWTPGGYFIFPGIMNTVIHTLMYGYYFMTVYDSKMKQSVGFKRNLTRIQIIQFGINVFLFGRPLFTNDCSISKSVAFVCVMQNLFLMCLFVDFYIKAYMRKKGKN